MPESKRYPENEAEHLEVRRRHHAVLEALGASLVTQVLTVTLQSADDEIPPVQELAAVHRAAWHWRTFRDDEHDGCWHLFVNEGPVSDLNKLLRLVANDECRGVMILPHDLAWIVAPYDGGADIITATSAERDLLAARFASWRSPYPGGT